jgi:KDO2-lipid IV(A) lauroyltransferase
MTRVPAAPPGALTLPDTPPRWYAHDWNRAAVYRVGAGVLGALPRRARLGLAAAVAAVAPFPAERAVVRANLARIAPGLTAAERRALARRVFRCFAMCFADLLTANRSDREAGGLLAGVEGEEHLHAALAAGRGVIFLTAHFGNWELAGRLLLRRFRRPTHVLVAAEPDPGVEAFLRGGGPLRFVTRDHPVAGVTLLAALRRNEVVAMQGDRGLGTRGDLALPFFGAPAAFPLGPFVLARAAGAPLLPAFCALRDDRRYAVTLGAPIRVAPEGEAAALAAWVRVLEDRVRRQPEQWFNFFDVWGGAPAR